MTLVESLPKESIILEQKETIILSPECLSFCFNKVHVNSANSLLSTLTIIL